MFADFNLTQAAGLALMLAAGGWALTAVLRLPGVFRRMPQPVARSKCVPRAELFDAWDVLYQHCRQNAEEQGQALLESLMPNLFRSEEPHENA